LPGRRARDPGRASQQQAFGAAELNEPVGITTKLGGNSGYIGTVWRPRNQLILALAFVVALSATLMFGIRAGRYARRLRWENEPVRPWMSVPFIAHTHHVPPEMLFQALGLPPHQHDRRPLRAIARAERRPVDDVMRDVEKALLAAGHVHPSLEPPGGKGP
jgi:hypothetical protein